MAFANKDQIRIIHVLKAKLGIDTDTYRVMLSGFGVTSSKSLTVEAAAELISELTNRAIAAGVWKQLSRKKKFDELGKRRGYATPDQLRMIDAMWAGVTRGGDLNHFLERRFGVSRIEWLPMNMVSKVRAALVAMKSQKEESHVE